MTVKELEAKVKMLEERIAELEGVEEEPDKEWLWDAEQAQVAADALVDAFDWMECPYLDEETWQQVCNVLCEIAQGEHE